MPTYSPVLIDTGSTDNLGSYSMAPNAYGWAQQNSPFVVGRALYFVAYRAVLGGSNTINVFKSLDLGATWQILDGANAPVRGNDGATGACYYDGADTVTVGWTDAATPPGAMGTIYLQDFTISTGTWGAAYGSAGSPTVYIVNQIYKRSDGTLIALFNRTYIAGVIQGLSAAVYTAGAWGAPFAVDSNVTAGSVSDGRCATVLDSIGTLHIFMECWLGTPLTNNFWSYQQVHLDNSLGAFHNFAITDAASSVFMSGEGNPVIVGSQLIYGVMNHALSNSILFVGTPLNNPVWTIGPAAGLDPAPPFSAGDSYYVPVLAASSTKIYALVRITDTSVMPPDLSLRLLQTSNLANPIAGPWTAQTIYDISSGPPSFNFNGQIWNNSTLGVYEPTPGAAQLFVTAGAQIDVTANQDTWFWFGNLVLPPNEPADCSALALATRTFSILTAQITVGIADAGLTTTNASGNPANADLGLTGSFTIGPTGIVTVAGKVRWENAQNLSNAGTLIDTGLSSNDPLVTAISLNQAKLNAYLAMPGAPLANTLTSETVNLNPGVTVCSSSLTCSDVIFNLTGGATDSYTIVILGDWTMDGVTLTGILSPNIVWAVQGSIYPDGANVIPGVFYFSTDFTVQGGTLTVNPGRLLGSAGSALTVQDGTALSITTPVCIAAVAQTPATIGGGPGTPGPNGVPFIISACKRRNDWDWCLLREELRLREICFPPMCNIPEEYRNLLPWDDTFGAIPPQAVPFLRPKGLLTPTPAAGDQVVVSFSLPRGYDGILSGIYQFYTGTGFINGSGDILWRIQLNQRYVKDLSNNPFSLGSPQYPFPMTEGQLLLAGQTVRYIVNVPNLSGQIQVGNSQIVCCLLGFAWPRG